MTKIIISNFYFLIILPILPIDRKIIVRSRWLQKKTVIFVLEYFFIFINAIKNFFFNLEKFNFECNLLAILISKEATFRLIKRD